jgi:hypothetical protein
MNDEPEFDLKVTGPDIAAALERHDYEWLVDNVFTPALAQFLRKQNTDALINNPRPRARRQAGTRRRRNHQTRRSDQFRP